MKQKIKKIKSYLKSSIEKTLFKYNPKNNFYYTKKIDELIFNRQSHFVAVFKDYLVYNDEVEFFHRYYNKDRIWHKLHKLINFYHSNSKIFPNYTKLYCSKYLYKNLEKKQAVIDEIYRNKKKLKMKQLQNNNEVQPIVFDKSAVYTIDNESISYYVKNINKIIDISQDDEDKSIENIENIISIIEKEEEKIEKIEKIKPLFNNKLIIPTKNLKNFSLKKGNLKIKIKKQDYCIDDENEKKFKEIKQFLLNNKKSKYNSYEKNSFQKSNFTNTNNTYYKNTSHLSGSISNLMMEQSPRLYIECKDLALSKQELKNKILMIEKSKIPIIPHLSIEKTKPYGMSSLSPSERITTQDIQKSNFLLSEQKFISPNKTHINSFFKVADFMKKNNYSENGTFTERNKLKKTNRKINFGHMNENFKSMNFNEVSTDNNPLTLRGKTRNDFYKKSSSKKSNEMNHFNSSNSSKMNSKFVKKFE